MNVSQFNTTAAKMVALTASRCLIGWGISLAIEYHVVSATWAADPKHITTLSILCVAGVYELEELAYNKWGLDIPGIVARVIALSKNDDQEIKA